MVQVFDSLDKDQINQIKKYLQEHYGQRDELDSYIDEVSSYYEAELAPYYVGTEQEEITGLLILDEVEDDIAYGRIFTKSVRFLEEISSIFLTVKISSLELETPKELPEISNLDFEYAEYMMALSSEMGSQTLSIQKECLSSLNKSVSLVPVTKEDREFYKSILEIQYDMESEEANERFDSLLDEDEMHGFLVYSDSKERIGAASYYEGIGFITLFDLTILPEYQGIGYGKKMLLSLLSETLCKNKKYLLQVTSSNLPAFHLYQKTGFLITEQQRFYSLELS